MAGRRAHNIESKLMMDELQDALRKPFHPLSAFSTPSGGVKVLGYRVGMSWISHRIFGLVIPDPAPTDVTEGTLLLEYPQARCYFIPDPTGNRLESVEIQTWFRHRNDEDLTTVGPWVKGPIVSGVAATEILAPTLYYREMYLQILSYTANGSVATSLTLFAAGAAGMDAEVSVSMTIPGGMAVTQPVADLLRNKPYMVGPGGGADVPFNGVPGLCPEILTQGINPALPALLVEWVPLQPGVTLTVTLGAGPVVAAAVGQAVTISSLIAGTTTVAQVQAAIAAVPAVVPLLRADGTGTDVFGATYAGLPVTPLFAYRTATAGGWFGFCADGTWRPVRLLADGSIEVSVTVADTLTVVQPTAADLNMTEVSAAAIKTATEKVAAEIVVGQGAPARPFLPQTPGAAATQQQGVPGRLPEDVPFTINTGKTIIGHPKQGGVSFIGANAAAAAVSAVNKVVTLTAKNDGTTTVTAMLALIAASPSVAALLSISGTGADFFISTFSVAETPLWASGTIPANALCVLGSDGYWWPAERGSTGGIKVSNSSLAHGEGDLVPPLRTIRRGSRFSGAAAANAVVTGGGTLLQIDVAASTAGTVLVYDSLTAAGTLIATIRCPISDTREVSPVCVFTTGLTVAFADLFAGTWSITSKED